MRTSSRGFSSPEFDRRSLLKGLAAMGGGALAGPMLAACSSGGTSSGGSGGATAKSMTFGLAQALDTNADPLQNIGHTFNFAAFDALTYVAPGKDAVGSLAQSFKRIDDTTMEFSLHPTAKFSNGDPVTAADVAFSIETILSKGYEMAADISLISKVETPGTTTVRVITSTPDALLEKRLGLVFIVPKSVYTSLGAAKFGQAPIGSGKYKIDSFTSNQQFTLSANPKSWQGPPKTPNVKLIEYSDENAFLSAFLAGQVDVAQALPSSGIPQLKRASGVDVNLALDGSAVIMSMDTTKAPFNDVRVRQAMNMAINVPEMISKVFNGAGSPLHSQLPGPDSFGYDSQLTGYPYNPAKAKALLAQAGYPSGFSTEIGGLDVNQTGMQAVAGYLKAIGVTAKVTVLPFATWVTQFGGKFSTPIFTTGLYQAPFYDADFAFQWPTIGTKGGTPHWKDAKWDSMLAAERAELDKAKRLTLLQQMSAYLKQQAPYIFLYEEKLVYGIRNSVQHFDPSTGLFMLIDSATKPA